MKQLSPSLEFQIDPDTKQTVVRVVDTTNNEVIKQIPSAQFLRISSAIEGLQQHILDEKA
jgi:flagellar protein FlaG